MKLCRVLLQLLVVVCLAVVGTIPASAQFANVSARNAILMEQSSGRVLYEKQAHEPEKIASITKIMTGLLAVESGRLADKVTISHTAVRVEGSAIYLRPGDKVKLEDLVYGLMLRSGNDAAQAIAEYVGGSVDGFVYLMNEKAKEIGMEHTHFSNPSGLDGDGTHLSSAYDMAVLTRYAMHNETFQKIFKTKSYQSDAWDYPWKNKHKLLTFMYEFATGGKTGFTKKAGRTLVTTASKDGLDLIVVTLGASSDWNDHMYLFDEGFKQYKIATAIKSGSISQVEHTAYKHHAYIKSDLAYPVQEKEREAITIDFSYVNKSNPQDGDIIGKASMKLNGQTVAERNVFYSEKKLFAKTGSVWPDFKQVFATMLGVM